MSAKQLRYEAFLSAVQRREDRVLLDAVPNLLSQLEELVNRADDTILAGTDERAARAKENWLNKSLPRLRQAYRDLRSAKDGHKVKVTIMFRGRERTHPELGQEILNRVAADTTQLAAVDSAPIIAGMDMNMVLRPLVPVAPAPTVAAPAATD